ncbi:MAG: UDP-N-acetylmuramoyl-tripeptide--D-alanyl-D-alanine ligase [Candidatus Palauibacterales bacterium]|nr:UDP-N-acetylmuramoyl-tripeptide--D-alanyl-D-alanine ligase [Candidatus Palauibacterales bacterium]
MSASFTAPEVREALAIRAPAEGRIRDDDPELRFTSVSTDTRDLQPGSLFVALRGENHDAMDFLEEAEAAGARGAVVRAGRELPPLEMALYPVADPRRALGELATYHRRRSGARVVAITGSSGKTTVKEMLAAALGGEPGVHRTPGNWNNRVGLPLTVLGAPAEAEVWVLELATSAPGEIARLAEIAGPDDALITTVGPAHLEGLGDVEGVLAEKLAVVEAASSDGNVVVGDRPPELPRAARQMRPDAVVAGAGADADFAPEEADVGPDRVAFRRGGVGYEVQAGGEHHLRDALMAAAMAEGLGRRPEEVARGLASYRPLGLRGAVRRYGDLTVIADCYNANPESFEAAIDWCRSTFADRRRVAVVGSMLELGEASEEAHRDVARRLAESSFEVVAATGLFRPAAERLNGHAPGVDVVTAEDNETLWERLRGRLRGDEVILVKGSRGAHMEDVVERLAERYGEGEG